jgi:hypothetical protein
MIRVLTWFCRHDWEKIVENETEVDLSNSWHNYYTHWVKARAVLLKCKKCGMIKRVIC